jgi:hypothetical protein
MTPDQLTFDGDAVPYPTPRPRHLTERQRDLLRAIRRDAPGLTFRTREAALFYADASGGGRWKAT